VITSARGSKFYLCRRAELDPSFKRYPPLPVRQCSGFEEDGRQATTRTRE